MHVALAPAYAIAILLPAGPDDGCPSPRQVAEALTAHLPGVVTPVGRPPGQNNLRLAVATDAAGELRVDLTDPEGGPLLRRRVAPETPGSGTVRARSVECAALAETAALIVDRYWHEVGYEIPPAPPKPPPPPAPPPPVPPPPPPPPKREEPPRREEVAPRPPPEAKPIVRRALATGPPPAPGWWIAPGIGGEIPDRGPWHTAVSLAFALERPAWGQQRLGLRFSVGARDPDHTVVSDGGTVVGSATAIQLPIRLEAYLAVPIGFGRLEPGLGVGLDVIVMTSTLGKLSQNPAYAPGGEALLAWSIPLPHNIFVRADAAGGAYFPYVIRSTEDYRVLFQTPRMRLELGLELGLWFR